MSHDHIFMPEDHLDKLYNGKNPIVRFVFSKRLDLISEMIPQNPSLKVLDAGCGEGHLLERLHKNLKHHSFTGIDITDIALKKAKERCPFATIQKMDLYHLNLPDNSFDVVICTEVLEHISDYRTAIKELIRVVKHGGFLIITFPNEQLWTLSRIILLRRPIKVPDHINSFYPYQIIAAVKLPLVHQAGWPFNLPFQMTLGYLQKFKKK